MTIPRQTATMLPIDLLVPHPENVRKSLGDVSELAASIRQNGLIQPIVVTQQPSRKDRYLVLAGHRRLEASKRIGLRAVPVVVRHDVGHMADHLTLMLVENVQRTQLSPIEKAEGIRELMALGLTQADVARTTGMHPSTVNSLLLINELDETSLEALKVGDLTVGDAQAAVRRERAATRERLETPTRGRPVQADPPHFRKSHPLAGYVDERCDHSTRPKVGGAGCGQCWEDVIREDAQIGLGGVRPMPTPAREVDEVAVQRGVSGDKSVRLNVAEKREAVRVLHARGLSDGDIAQTIGHTPRQVHRIRQELDLPANFDSGGLRVNA
jgi:ParB family chromosome partitioning protein